MRLVVETAKRRLLCCVHRYLFPPSDARCAQRRGTGDAGGRRLERGPRRDRRRGDAYQLRKPPAQGPAPQRAGFRFKKKGRDTDRGVVFNWGYARRTSTAGNTSRYNIGTVQLTRTPPGRAPHPGRIGACVGAISVRRNGARCLTPARGAGGAPSAAQRGTAGQLGRCRGGRLATVANSTDGAVLERRPTPSALTLHFNELRHVSRARPAARKRVAPISRAHHRNVPAASPVNDVRSIICIVLDHTISPNHGNGIVVEGLTLRGCCGKRVCRGAMSSPTPVRCRPWCRRVAPLVPRRPSGTDHNSVVADRWFLRRNLPRAGTFEVRRQEAGGGWAEHWTCDRTGGGCGATINATIAPRSTSHATRNPIRRRPSWGRCQAWSRP